MCEDNIITDKPVICPQCGEFIGNAGDFDECPLCGNSLDGNII